MLLVSRLIYVLHSSMQLVTGIGVDFAKGVPLRTLGSDGTGVGTLVSGSVIRTSVLRLRPFIIFFNFFLFNSFLYAMSVYLRGGFHLGNFGFVAGPKSLTPVKLPSQSLILWRW